MRIPRASSRKSIYRTTPPLSLKGFTIVELLIVIVVIAILAAITIVAFNGVQTRARASQASTALSQAKRKLELYKVDNSAYPTTANLANAGITDADTDYQYTSDGTTYCLTATATTVSYYLNSTTQAAPTAGGCAGHGQGGVAAITNYIYNPSFEVNTTGWGPRLSAVLARTTAEHYEGVGALSVTTPGVQADEGVNLSNTTGVVSSGEAVLHTGSGWIKAPVGAQLRLLIEDYTSANVYIGGTMTVFSGTGSWQRVSVSRTTATATNKFVLNVRTNAIFAGTYYVDCMMITKGSSLYNYADGSSANWAWNGTAHASASTGPAL